MSFQGVSTLTQFLHFLTSVRTYLRISAYFSEVSVSLVPSGYYRSILGQQPNPQQMQTSTTQEWIESLY